LRIKRFIFSGLGIAALAAAPLAHASTSPTSTGGEGPAPPPSGQSTQTQGTQSGESSPSSGGAEFAPPPPGVSTPARPTVQGFVAKIIHGVAYAPSYAPLQVKEAIWAGDRIRHKPYVYGGGHGAWAAAGYDCSGSVSYVLHAAGLLRTPFDSSQFETWGQPGSGQWITVYTNPGHAFIEIAGIRFDTSSYDDPHPPPGSGPRWRPIVRRAPGFRARHPAGF